MTMDDPIERATLSEGSRYALEMVEVAEAALSKHDNDTSRAIAAACAVYEWLTEQGIPIDKLLSGEMEAVATQTTWVADGGRIEPMRDAGKMPEEVIEQAKLDYAGGQAVTPEGRQGPSLQNENSDSGSLWWCCDRCTWFGQLPRGSAGGLCPECGHGLEREMPSRAAERSTQRDPEADRWPGTGKPKIIPESL